MNSEARRQAGPAHASQTTRNKPSILGGLQQARIAIVTALEALEVGDQELAVAILLGALEGPVADPKSRTRCPRPPCPFRGWAGEVERHVAIAHPEPVLEPARPPRRLIRSTPRARA